MTNEEIRDALNSIAEGCDKQDSTQRAVASLVYFLIGILVNGRIVKICSDLYPMMQREARVNKAGGN